MNKGILRPVSYDDTRALWRGNETEETGIAPEDKGLHELAQMSGWKTLHEHINNLMIGLDKRLSEAVLGGLGDEQIKRDATFSVLGKELLNSIINKVEDSSLVVEELEYERNERESKDRK